MPAVLSGKAQQLFYFEEDDVLCEVLGHSDFDGYPFCVEDEVVFEDGTLARIMREPGQKFYVLSEGTRSSVREVFEASRRLQVEFPTQRPNVFLSISSSKSWLGFRSHDADSSAPDGRDERNPAEPAATANV